MYLFLGEAFYNKSMTSISSKSQNDLTFLLKLLNFWTWLFMELVKSNTHTSFYEFWKLCCIQTFYFCSRPDPLWRPSAGSLRGGTRADEDIRENLPEAGHGALPGPHGLQQLLRPPAGRLGAASRWGRPRSRGWTEEAAGAHTGQDAPRGPGLRGEDEDADCVPGVVQEKPESSSHIWQEIEKTDWNLDSGLSIIFIDKSQVV